MEDSSLKKHLGVSILLTFQLATAAIKTILANKENILDEANRLAFKIITITDAFENLS